MKNKKVNKKEKKGHDCSLVWRRRKFIIDKRDSVGPDRDIWENPERTQED